MENENMEQSTNENYIPNFSKMSFGNARNDKTHLNKKEYTIKASGLDEASSTFMSAINDNGGLF